MHEILESCTIIPANSENPDTMVQLKKEDFDKLLIEQRRLFAIDKYFRSTKCGTNAVTLSQAIILLDKLDK